MIPAGTPCVNPSSAFSTGIREIGAFLYGLPRPMWTGVSFPTPRETALFRALGPQPMPSRGHNGDMPTAGAQGVSKTVELLNHFADLPLQVERRDTSIKIVPQIEGGFPIMVYDEGAETMIAAERWHTHYEEPAEVAYCALWLLTPFYRVVHETKGGVLVAAWIERYEETGWEGFEPVYFLNPEHAESWILAPGEHYQRRYMQQAVLPPPQPYEQLCPGAVLDEDGLPPDWRHGSWLVTADEAIGPTLFGL